MMLLISKARYKLLEKAGAIVFFFFFFDNYTWSEFDQSVVHSSPLKFRWAQMQLKM